jgi:hypothetical protein
MALYRKMAAAGATVIILHHVGRDIDQDYRGSSDIKASVDVAYKLTKTDRKPQLGTLQLRAFKQRISVTPVIYLKYQDGQFSVDVDDCPPADSAVSFVELLKANPGITQNAFESLPTVKKLGRNRARAFLAGGTESGVRIERRGKANIHFWCDPNARGSDRAQDSIAAARAPRVDGE